MQVILQGNLRHFAPAELLSFLCSRDPGGTLDLESSGKRARIYFKDRRILWAEASDGAEAADAVILTFDWTVGSFTLLDSDALPENAPALALEPSWLMEEAKRRAEEAQLFPAATAFKVVESPAQSQVNLTGEEFKLLFRIAAGRTFKELVDEIGVSRKEMTQRLRHLEGLGLISVAGQDMSTQAIKEKDVPRKTRARKDTVSQKAPAPPAPVAEPAGDKTVIEPRAAAPAAAPSPAPAPAPAPAPKERKHTLMGSLTPDDAPDTVHPLMEDVATIGRVASNTIPIQDGSISSNHARITRTDEGFFIEDLKSRNGTFVNGEKVTEKRKLADGDLVRIGKVLMTFNLASHSAPSESTQPEFRAT
jgi:hypothetical protein